MKPDARSIEDCFGNRGSSVEQLERSTNGLKRQMPKNAYPIQWPANFALIHWTLTKQVHWIEF